MDKSAADMEKLAKDLLAVIADERKGAFQECANFLEPWLEQAEQAAKEGEFVKVLAMLEGARNTLTELKNNRTLG